MSDIKLRRCKRSRAWNREQWRGHVAAHAQSGLAIEDYCVAHGLKRRTFHRWRRRFMAEAEGSDDAGRGSTARSKVAFAEVLVAGTQRQGDVSGIEVVLLSERRLLVGAGFDEETLRRVVSVLESVPC